MFRLPELWTDDIASPANLNLFFCERSVFSLLFCFVFILSDYCFKQLWNSNNILPVQCMRTKEEFLFPNMNIETKKHEKFINFWYPQIINVTPLNHAFMCLSQEYPSLNTNTKKMDLSLTFLTKNILNANLGRTLPVLQIVIYILLIQHLIYVSERRKCIDFRWSSHQKYFGSFWKNFIQVSLK